MDDLRVSCHNVLQRDLAFFKARVRRYFTKGFHLNASLEKSAEYALARYDGFFVSKFFPRRHKHDLVNIVLNKGDGVVRAHGLVAIINDRRSTEMARMRQELRYQLSQIQENALVFEIEGEACRPHHCGPGRQYNFIWFERELSLLRAPARPT